MSIIYRGFTGTYSISNKSKVFAFTFKISYLAPKKWSVNILKIEDVTFETDKPLCLKTTKNQCLKWINKFYNSTDEFKESFLIKRGIQYRIPQKRHYVSFSVIDSDGVRKNYILDKSQIVSNSEEIDPTKDNHIDGIDRIKDMTKDMYFVGRSSLYLGIGDKKDSAKKTAMSTLAIQGKSVLKKKIVNFKIKSK